MTDHKFTEEQIIEALEIRMPHDAVCREAYALINRQKAEIESLNAIHADALESLRLAAEANKDMQAEIERLEELAAEKQNLTEQWQNKVGELLAEKQIIKAEAIKEFAERLKADMSNIARMEYGGNIYFCVGYDLIDTLVKEMTEEKENESKNT